MNRKKLGIILMITGLVLLLGLIAIVVITDYRTWILNLDGFQHKYSSFSGMLYSREKGAFLISVMLGLPPIFIGAILICKSKHH